ncbi:MAG: YidC/Oxa1 family membrane protein insertase, partial [Candidatus Dormibacteraceae bacterium]
MPIRDLWWAVFGVPINLVLNWLYASIDGIPWVAWIGAYGVALILLTVGIKVLLSPLTHFQLKTAKKNLDNQRRLAPELAEIKRQHKGDMQKQQAATMALYRERGVNPVASGLVGCLPALIQVPILIALNSVLISNARNEVVKHAHFLFLSNLNASPKSMNIPGTPIPVPAYLIVPLLAAALTYIQSR